MSSIDSIAWLAIIASFICIFGSAWADDRAEVNIRVSGACSPIYLSRRGIELSKYRPIIRFNPDKIQLIPKNPVIPGCVKIKAEGVEILKPVRNLLAEVEMRIGGTPDPSNPPLPCTKKVDDKVNQCPCAKTEGSCVFCDFCRQMRSQSARVSLSERVSPSSQGGARNSGDGANTRESLEEACRCELMQPGLYDIETEMCTPELDDAKQFIPPEIQNNIVQKTPVISWLELGDADMPHFLAMYFEQPDAACHTEGPDSDLVKSGLIYVDAMINYLMYRLDRKGLFGCLNIVIVSDHGGQAMHPEKFTAVSDFVDITDTNLEVFPGAVGHLNFHNLSMVNVTRVVEPFVCRLNHSFRVYTKHTIPRRYHYTNNRRIGPVLFDGYLGARIFKSHKELNGFKDRGDHGYDNRNREMRAIFGAYGPDVRPQNRIEPFQNIELYNLFTDLMRLPFTAETNGTRGVLYPVLKNPPSYIDTEIIELESCRNVELVKCGDGCYFKLSLLNGPQENDNLSASKTKSTSIGESLPVENSAEKRTESSKCQRLARLEAPRKLAIEMDLCELEFCNASMAYSRREQRIFFVESVLSLPVANIDHRANCGGILQFHADPNGENSGDDRSGILAIEAHPTETIPTVAMESVAFPSSTRWSGTGKNPATQLSPPLFSQFTTTKTETARRRGVQRRQLERAQTPRAVRINVADFLKQRKVEDTEKETNSSERPAVEDSLDLSGEANVKRKRQIRDDLEKKSSLTLFMDQTEQLKLFTNNSNSKSTTKLICKNVKWNSGPWISLFPDNDYTRYVFQGQIRVPLGFYNGPWKHLLDLILKYQRHYQKLLMYVGPIFDYNNDGLADPLESFGSDKKQPSHVYVLLIRCSSAEWRKDYRACANVSETSTLAFVLPLVEKDDNCLFMEEYLFLNTVRIRDIELMTNFEWFTNRRVFSAEAALRLRMRIPQQLWQLERGV